MDGIQCIVKDQRQKTEDEGGKKKDGRIKQT